MRILLVHNHYKHSGGEDTVFFAEKALLQEHGHVVDTFTLSNEHVNSFKEKLEAALGVVYNFRYARQVEAKLIQFKPDVVHVHNFFPLISPAVFYVCRKLSIPVVMTLHNYRLICPSVYLFFNGQLLLENVQKVLPLKPVLQGVYRNSKIETASVVLATGVHKLLGTWRNKIDKLITLTPSGVELFQNSSLNPRPEQLVVKPNFAADLGVGADEREGYFLFVGRLSPEKGLSTLLKAHQLRPFPLVIVGDGPLREEVEPYAAQNPSVTYKGFQQKEQVVALMKKATALIFPSEWYETFGMSIVEAFSTGTPAIAANMGGAAYLVQHQHNGLLYTPKQAHELAEQVRLLQEQPGLARELGNNARHAYLKQYTPEANYQMLLRIYQDVVKQKKKPAPAVAEAGLA